jgi:hypothetical protein
MKKRLSQNITVLLVSALVMLGLFEVLLRVVDPLGVDRLATTLWQISQAIDPDDERGFGLPTGNYRLAGWRMAIDDDRNRVTPNATDADCKITFVGDSITIGQGVNDAAVWVNLLAEDAQATYINAGFSGYNIYQVAQTLNVRESDGYVYLLVYNDPYIAIPFETSGKQQGFSLRRFIQLRLLRATYSYGLAYRAGLITGERLQTPQTEAFVGHTELESSEELDRFFDIFAEIAERDDVLILGFDDSALTVAVQEKHEGVVAIPNFTDTISWFDAHASEEGNRELAAHARDAVEAFTQQVCEL